MKAKEIKKGIYWVGGIDWDLRNFHGYLTQRGSTYNSYLIIDEKITLIDNVKHYLYDEMLTRIKSIIEPDKIDYIVQNHVEMDHSGTLPKLKQIAKNAVIVTSPNGKKGLEKHYDTSDWEFRVVSTGDNLNIGKRNLEFLLTPMVHWPDNMLTFCLEEKILFSNDSFGQHIASSERFDDEYPYNIIMEEAKKYYANIVLPYGNMVQKELKAAAKLDIEIIAPSHGLIWRKHIPQIVEKYKKWSENKADEKALIIYDTMWKSTEKIAVAVQDAFENMNIKTRKLNLRVNHISDIMTEVLNSKYICVGSPTLNNNMLPTVASFLTYLKGLAPKNRFGLAFGSYGWGGQSIGLVENELKSCKFDLLNKIKVNYIPRKQELKKITQDLETQINDIN